jgi:hypothetical protein
MIEAGLKKLAGSSGAMGTGIGAAFGQALGAPGASIRNMIDAATGGTPDGDSAWMRALPGILALLGGGATAAMGGLPLGMLAGAGIGGLGQAVGEATENPTFDPISGRDLSSKILGSDPGAIGGMGIEMALDPLTFAGGIGGKALPGILEKRTAESAVAGQRAARAAQIEGGALSGATKAGSGAATAVEDVAKASGSTLEQAATHSPGQGTRNSWESFLDESNAASKQGYKPEVVSSTPDFLRMDPSKVGKTYQNVNPALKDELSLLGYANPTGGNSANLNVGQVPAWAESRGGWLMPSRERMAAQADAGAGASMMRNEGARARIGPRIDAAAGPEGLMAQSVGPSPSLNLTADDLMTPAEKYLKMRQGVPGLGELSNRSPLASAIGGSPVEDWLRRQAVSKSTGRY